MLPVEHILRKMWIRVLGWSIMFVLIRLLPPPPSTSFFVVLLVVWLVLNFLALYGVVKFLLAIIEIHAHRAFLRSVFGIYTWQTTESYLPWVSIHQDRVNTILENLYRETRRKPYNDPTCKKYRQAAAIVQYFGFTVPKFELQK